MADLPPYLLFVLIQGKLFAAGSWLFLGRSYLTILRVGDVSLFGVRVPRLMKCTRCLGGLSSAGYARRQTEMADGVKTKLTGKLKAKSQGAGVTVE